MSTFEANCRHAGVAYGMSSSMSMQRRSRRAAFCLLKEEVIETSCRPAAARVFHGDDVATQNAWLCWGKKKTARYSCHLPTISVCARNSIYVPTGVNALDGDSSAHELKVKHSTLGGNGLLIIGG